MLKSYLGPALKQAFSDGGAALMQDVCDSLTLEQLEKARVVIDAAIARKKNSPGVSITVKPLRGG